MSNEYLDFIVFLENSLGSFYANLKQDTSLERIQSLLDFMETHSFEHAKKIRETKIIYIKPELSENEILTWHNDLIRKVTSKLTNGKNLVTVLEELATSEESLGNLYKKIASVLINISEHYK